MNEWETCIAEWATRCHEKDATIAALQARVSGLEKDSELLRQSRDDFRVKYESVKNDAITLQSQLTQRTAEFQRHDGELQQICGQVLGYPWFKDDQKSFPGATEKDGVCVGEHVGITIAQELANAYRKRTAELEAAKASQAIDLKNNNACREQVATLQAELARVRGELATYKETKHDAI